MTRRQRRTTATRRQQPAPLFVFWTCRTEDRLDGWELVEHGGEHGLVPVGHGTRYTSLRDATEARDRCALTNPNAARSLRAVRWHARQA
jgi:hypothetical protein